MAVSCQIMSVHCLRPLCQHQLEILKISEEMAVDVGKMTRKQNGMSNEIKRKKFMKNLKSNEKEIPLRFAGILDFVFTPWIFIGRSPLESNSISSFNITTSISICLSSFLFFSLTYFFFISLHLLFSSSSFIILCGK